MAWSLTWALAWAWTWAWALPGPVRCAMGRAGRRRVSRITGRQGTGARTAGTCGAAGPPHSLAWHAVTEQPGVAHRAARAGARGLRLVRRRTAWRHARAGHGLGARHARRPGMPAGRGIGWPGMGARHRLARCRLARHRRAGSWRLPLAHVIAGRPRYAARAVWHPAGAWRVHPRLVAGAWRRRAAPARWRPVLACARRAGLPGPRAARTGAARTGPPQGRDRPGWGRSGYRGRRCAGFPGSAGRPARRGRDRRAARRSGRPGCTRSWGSPPAAGRNVRRPCPAGRGAPDRGSAACGRGASWRWPGVSASGLDILDLPSRPTAKSTRTTRPNAIPAAITYSPIRVRWAGGTGGCLLTCRRTTLAAMRRAPAITVAAAATARKRTRRILLVAVAWERTGQRSHRGYRPASQMASRNHYDLSFGA